MLGKKSKKQKIIVYLFFYLIESKAFLESHNQTIVEEEESNRTTSLYIKSNEDDMGVDDASKLNNIKGFTTVSESGPLSMSTPRYRGLSSSRLNVFLDGLSLNNPVNGFADGNALFLFAANNFCITGSKLDISLPKFDSPKGRASIGYGSLDTMKLHGSFGAPIDDHSDIFLAILGAKTTGDFSFSDKDIGNDHTFIRGNNDQQRFNFLTKYQRKTDTFGAHSLLAISLHEGGIPGFAFSGTKNLRVFSKQFYLSAGLSKKIRLTEYSLNINNSFFDYQSKDDDQNKERMLSSAHEIGFGLSRLNLPSWMDISVEEKLIIEKAYSLNQSRVGGGLVLKRQSKFNFPLNPKISSNFSVVGYSFHGLIFNSDVFLSIEPFDFLSFELGYARNQRLPTFMEMYADNLFFMGNESLRKESIWDFELSSKLNFAEVFSFEVTGFLGLLSDSIVYLMYHANKLKPENLASAKRFGTEFSISLEPITLIGFESKNSFLYTSLKSTKAPLPHAPFFSGLSKLRVGKKDLLSLTMQSRYRSSEKADIYGAIDVSGYVLFDAYAYVKILSTIGLSLSLNNIFNVKTARDNYQIPIPGLLFFSEIEWRNL